MRAAYAESVDQRPIGPKDCRAGSSGSRLPGLAVFERHRVGQDNEVLAGVLVHRLPASEGIATSRCCAPTTVAPSHERRAGYGAAVACLHRVLEFGTAARHFDDPSPRFDNP